MMDLSEDHRRNRKLIELYTPNWYALALAITRNYSVDKALIELGVPKESKARGGARKSLIPEYEKKVKNAVKLRIEQGLSYEEIAEIIGIPRGSIHTMINRELKKKKSG